MVAQTDGDARSAGAYKVALSRGEGPSLFALSRQAMAELPGCSVDGVLKGGYTVDDSDGTPSHILIGTGSEVPLCAEAAKQLRSEGHNPRVVSMPCMELFFEQDEQYRLSVLPKECTKRVSVEAASTFGWREIVGDAGTMIGMHTFGSSAPGDVLMEKFGFTADKVAEAARAL